MLHRLGKHRALQRRIDLNDRAMSGHQPLRIHRLDRRHLAVPVVRIVELTQALFLAVGCDTESRCVLCLGHDAEAGVCLCAGCGELWLALVLAVVDREHDGRASRFVRR
jgi:hypothetical protein